MSKSIPIMVPKTMSGVFLTRHGGPEVLEHSDDILVPTPKAGEVLVAVLASGINNIDINTRLDWYASGKTKNVDDITDQSDTADDDGGSGVTFPLIQGGDLCGRVAALGDGVCGFKIGQRVTCPTVLTRPGTKNQFGDSILGVDMNGAFAEFCLLQERDLFDVGPSPLTDVEIAAIPCAFSTAENLLARAGVYEGHRVLITGASGGVGLAAVQLAKLRGATVTGVCAPTKSAEVLTAGAKCVLNRNDVPQKAGYDMVIDVVGGPAWPHLITALRPGGHYAVAGAIAGPMVEADLRDIYLHDITIHGCTHQAPEIFQRLVTLINAGDIRPLVSRTYPLTDIALAQEDFASKRYPGKLALLPQKDIP